MESYSDIFAKDNRPLKATGLVTHKIDMGDYAPITKAPYKIPFALRDEMKQQTDYMYRDNVVPEDNEPIAL